ncbi:chlorophyll a/b-binding protein [Prochlorococcus marinus]|uniref:Possible high light inducible protein n=1 Tax=Prochlorococcus marinus (strain MIT 9211) TaxID=93059 RepID=A9BBT7_PROM4|nr:chlorophyll a/b-binding protein [Prochlorococcus marinus]ABX09299.1 possible high light inducible protein [Prochlorococcus marinus str. MIT 9211]
MPDSPSDSENNFTKNKLSSLEQVSKASLTEAKWIDNSGEAVEKVFGFNQNAELVNGRAAMFGFLMLVITEIVFGGQATTHSIFGIG